MTASVRWKGALRDPDRPRSIEVPVLPKNLRGKLKDLFAPSPERTPPAVPRDITMTDTSKPSSTRMTADAYELFNAVPELRRVMSSGPGYIEGEDPYGQRFRVDASRPLRNNSPGNLKSGDFSDTHGRLANDGGYAVFPTRDVGEKALRTLLFQPDSKYRNMPVDSAIGRFAPKEDKNDTERYQRFVKSRVGTNAPINKLTTEQRESLLEAIRQFEGLYQKGATVTMGGKTWPTQARKPERNDR